MKLQISNVLHATLCDLKGIVNIFSSLVIILTFLFICVCLYRPKDPKKMSGCHSSLGSETVVTYFFCGEEIPYRRMMKTHSLTLGHFKEQLRKKGNYRYTLNSGKIISVWWLILRLLKTLNLYILYKFAVS